MYDYVIVGAGSAGCVAGVRMAMEILRTAPLASHVGAPIMAPAGDSDEEVLTHVRQTMQSLYHPVGTCRMGHDELAVVDPELRVRGVEGLRVVDASVCRAARQHERPDNRRGREGGRRDPRARGRAREGGGPRRRLSLSAPERSGGRARAQPRAQQRRRRRGCRPARVSGGQDRD